MGHKVNPRSFRQTTTYSTPSRWFASKQDFAALLQQDVEMRKMIQKKFREAGVARIEIERAAGEVTIIIRSSKPGVIIGRGGSLIEELKKEVKRRFFGSEKIRVTINIQEVREPDINAELIYQSIRDQIEARVPFRRAMKRALENVVRANAKGCRITVSGRLNGADIARTETVTSGRLPLHTLRANIDYSRGIAHTVYGVIGVKVWVYNGDVFGDETEEQEEKKPRRRPRRQRKQMETGGQKVVLRKKADVDRERAEKTVTQSSTEESN